MNRLIFSIYNFPIWLLTLLPLNVLYILSDFFFVIIYFAGYRKKVVMTNLQNSFPEKTITELKKIARRFYRHFCDSFIESIYALHMSENEIRKRFRYKNSEILNRFYKENKSVILVFGHYGNWDWLNGMPLITKHQVAALYHPLSNRYFDELFKRIRCRFGVKLIPMKTSYKEMLTDAQKGTLTATYFLTDQRPVWSSIRYWTTFLNQETPVLTGSEVVAAKLGQPVIYLDIQKIKRGYYEAEFEIISEHPGLAKEYEITELHTRKLENIIVKKPEYWLWSHKRWKHKREEIEKRLKKKHVKNSNSNTQLER
ncbi:MAG: lysophospholipid acyltransferase family protein [Bacteroidales bacterium]|nr:lysophospholipid acyltransferase family protein [Bacteroidales bacterium]